MRDRGGAARWLSGVPVGRVLGIPVTVTPSWFLSVAVIAVIAGPVVRDLVPSTGTLGAYAVAVLLAVLLGLSVLAHELGHCLMARRFGVGVVRVQLFLLGGVSEIARTPRGAGEEAAVAIAGPIVSAALTAVFSAAVPFTDPGSVLWLIAIEMALANGVVAVFNLLPALPLDGGRVLRAGIWARSGSRRKGTTAAVIGGYLIAAALVVWSVYRLTTGDRGAIVQGLIGIAMAYYIGVGAHAEQTDDEPPAWPPGVSVASLARPIVGVPAETPVGLALASAADREVVLLGLDGVAEGILDVVAARSLAAHSPKVPAGRAAHRVDASTIVLFSDGPVEIVQQLQTVAATHFLLIGQDGQPQGVLRREDFPGGLRTAARNGTAGTHNPGT